MSNEKDNKESEISNSIVSAIGNAEQVIDILIEKSREKAQVDANFENILNKEEIAWTAMIASSNRLTELLGYGPETFILPVEYTPVLTEKITFDREGVIDSALENRPELKAANSDLESSDVFFRFRKNQNRPDLSLSFNLSFSQVETYYGYDSWNESMGNLFDPDT